MIVSPLADPDVSRVAYAVPRAVGSAVRRNRLRRRLRAHLADLDRHGRLPASSYLVICRAGAGDLTTSELTSCIDDLLDRASLVP
jgi:ribonuclease P protein component